MKTATLSHLCIASQHSEPPGVRSVLPSSHLRKRRRANGRRGLPVLVPALPAPRRSSVQVRYLDSQELRDPDGAAALGKLPRVLHIDPDLRSATVLAALLMPEARVIHVPTLAEARRLLATEIFSLVVLDPNLPDGDAAELLPALAATPLLVYAGRHPDWHLPPCAYLPKPWTTPRQLWTTLSGMLGIVPSLAAGD